MPSSGLINKISKYNFIPINGEINAINSSVFCSWAVPWPRESLGVDTQRSPVKAAAASGTRGVPGAQGPVAGAEKRAFDFSASLGKAAHHGETTRTTARRRKPRRMLIRSARARQVLGPPGRTGRAGWL